MFHKCQCDHSSGRKPWCPSTSVELIGRRFEPAFWGRAHKGTAAIVNSWK
jgi:hypothetical protein